MGRLLATTKHGLDTICASARWAAGKGHAEMTLQLDKDDGGLSFFIGHHYEKGVGIPSRKPVLVSMDKAQALALRNWLNANLRG
jgi:hypothetical protein